MASVPAIGYTGLACASISSRYFRSSLRVRWTTASCAGREKAVSLRSTCRTCGSLPRLATAPWTTVRSAAGKLFHQETARRYAQLQRIIFICGRYEGVDERVAEHLATDEISIGDFVLSGGELPAMMIVDAVTRLLPGALGNEASSQNESFSASHSTVPGSLRPARESDAAKS